jgi:hypothetical protein
MVELTSTSASNGTRNWYLYWYRCISSVDVFIREEAYRFSEMARGFEGRIHPRHVRSIHSTQSDDRGTQQQRPQYSSQASGQQQSYPRPPAPRGRGARGFGGKFGDQPRKIYCLFCGEDKGHTTRMCHVTI